MHHDASPTFLRTSSSWLLKMVCVNCYCILYTCTCVHVYAIHLYTWYVILLLFHLLCMVWSRPLTLPLLLQYPVTGGVIRWRWSLRMRKWLDWTRMTRRDGWTHTMASVSLMRRPMYVHVRTCMYMYIHVCTCTNMYVHVQTCLYHPPDGCC